MPNLAELAAKEIRDNERMRVQLEMVIGELGTNKDLIDPNSVKTTLEKILHGESTAK